VLTGWPGPAPFRPHRRVVTDPGVGAVMVSTMSAELDLVDHDHIDDEHDDEYQQA
jgi:hypothetical protein